MPTELDDPKPRHTPGSRAGLGKRSVEVRDLEPEDQRRRLRVSAQREPRIELKLLLGAAVRPIDKADIGSIIEALADPLLGAVAYTDGVVK